MIRTEWGRWEVVGETGGGNQQPSPLPGSRRVGRKVVGLFVSSPLFLSTVPAVRAPQLTNVCVKQDTIENIVPSTCSTSGGSVTRDFATQPLQPLRHCIPHAYD